MSGRHLCFVVALVVAATPLAAQSAEAEREYRVARRLAAERSADAAAAFDRVVALDPDGPLADDALLGRAALLGLPSWPEQLGRLDVARVGTAKSLLARVLSELPQADRRREAAFRLALLGLEPVAGYDRAATGLQLLTIASHAEQDRWAFAARYTLAWLAETSGKSERAAAAYQRIRIDAPGTEHAARANVALGRVRLGEQRPGAAAASFQRALESLAGTTTAALQATALRRLAVDTLFARVRTADALRMATELRPNAIAALPGNGALIAQRKRNEVVEYDAGGQVVARWTIEQPLAVAANVNGLRVAVTADAVFRLEPEGGSTRIGSPGEFGSFSAGTVDDLGRLWVLDRRGERVGRIEPGSDSPLPLWSERGARLSGLVWDGTRLLTVDTRGRRLLAIFTDASSRTLADGELDRPIAVAADRAGRIAVLDSRGTQLLFFDAKGVPLGTLAVESVGLGRAVAVGFDPSGALHLVEESSGLWWRAQ